MAEAIENVRHQLNDYFSGMEKKQKTKIAVAALLILISATGLLYYFTRPEYILIYDNLDAAQAGEVMTVLEGNDIQARFGDTAGTILVNKKDEKRAQVLVATQGLPTARFSYEDAFSNSFMMTSEERSQRFLYAQQNYLASTIEEIPWVSKAYVNLTVPESNGFILGNDNQTSKASVLIELASNAAPDSKSINGIAVLVANAVQGLNPDNVTIHGTDGRILNVKTEENEVYNPNSQLGLQQTVQKDLELSITDFLSTVYGYGNVVAMANVKLDFDSEVTEIIEFSPPIEGETNGMIRSLQELQSSSSSEGVGGVPGTDSNTDTTQYVEVDPSSSIYEEASRTINYEINELRQKIVKAQGQVADITVAVYINSSALANGELTAEERRDLTNIISAAAGLDTRVVQVGVQQFNNSLTDQFVGSDAPIGGLAAVPIWLWGIMAALVLGIAYMTVATLRKRKKDEELPFKEIAAAADELEELDLELSGSQVKQQIEKLVTKKPDAVAQLLRNWLSED